MEINLRDQIPVFQGNTGTSNIAVITPVPVDQSFVQALSGKKIKEATPGEVLEAVSAAVEKAWFDRQLKPVDEKDMKQLKISIAKDFISCFGAMTLNEIGNCFHHWIRGKYKKFYSVNVVEAGQAMSDYLTDQDRAEAVKATKPKELPEPKPGKERLFEMGKINIAQAIAKHNNQLPLGSLGPVCYNFLDVLGLMTYPAVKKRELLVKALDEMIIEVKLRISKESETSKIIGLKNQLSLFTTAKENGTALAKEEYQLVINKAKELTVKLWLDDYNLAGVDIENSINRKKETYLNEKN